jgi:hypothetical protein
LTLVAGTASADVGTTEASAKGKGVVGGALLGAELVCGVEAIAGVKSPWAYLGGGVAGAVGGGIGGHFVEKNGSPRASMLLLAGGMTLVIPTIVGVLSATVYQPPADYLTDKPPADEPVANPPQPDNNAPVTPGTTPAAPPGANPSPPPTMQPSAAPPPSVPPASSPTPAPSPPPNGAGPASPAQRARKVAAQHRTLPPLALTPPALVALRPGALALSVPAIEIQPTYTRAELAMFGVKQTTEVHIPVVNVVF